MFVIRFDISFVPLQALQLRGRVSTGVPPSFACPKRRERIDSEQQAEKFRFAFFYASRVSKGSGGMSYSGVGVMNAENRGGRGITAPRQCTPGRKRGTAQHHGGG